MREKNRCRCHQSSRKTCWPTSHSDSWVVEFRSPNANLPAQIKTKMISHVYYYINLQLFSHKNIKPSFSCSGCFQPRATNFPFLILVMQINCIFFWTLFVKTSLLWSKHFVEFIFLYKQSKVFYLNSQRNKNFSGSFQPFVLIRKNLSGPEWFLFLYFKIDIFVH